VPVKKRGRDYKDHDVKSLMRGKLARRFFSGISQQLDSCSLLNEHRAFLKDLMQVRWKKLVDLNVAAIHT